MNKFLKLKNKKKAKKNKEVAAEQPPESYCDLLTNLNYLRYIECAL
jgi:hypothetical protein